MSNFEHNRILCNKETASHFLVSDDEIEKNQEYVYSNDSWFSTIDFRKALEIPIWNYDSKYVPQYYGFGIDVKTTKDGRYDIRFDTKWTVPYDVMIEFITRYKDVDWYAFEEEILEEEHYYWYKDSVVNDMNKVDEEFVSREYWRDDEADYELEDDRCIFDLIETPRFDQDKFVNYKPNKNSKEYYEYLELINKYADMAIDDIKNDKNYFLKRFEEYGYIDRLYEIDRTIRLRYLHEANIDRNKYNLSIMSSDISDLIIKKLNLKTKMDFNYESDIKNGMEVIIKKTGKHGVVISIYRSSLNKYAVKISETEDDQGYEVHDFKREELDIVTSNYPPIETKDAFIKNIDKIHVDAWVLKKIKRFNNPKETEEYIKKLIKDEKANVYTNGDEWYIRSSEDLFEVNKYSYNITNINKKEFSKW